ncbi:IS5 family transposase [bacterium]|nr:MAG: IS5 family transposase [bacterium]
MVRRVITDSIWSQLEEILCKHGCHLWGNERNIMEAILWKLRTGGPWRDIPSEFCPWQTAFNRFNRWSKKGPMGRFFFMLRKEVDKEWVFADGSYVRAHQHATGAQRGQERAIGRSAGGLTTKIHMCTDAHGNPLNFKITGGQVHDSKVANELIDLAEGAEYFIADKGYDADSIRIYGRTKGMQVIIPKRKNSTRPDPEFDAHLYKNRHLVENLFARLKHFRGIAMRFEKLARNFQSMLYIASMHTWLKLLCPTN